MPLGHVAGDNDSHYLSNDVVMDVIRQAYPLEALDGQKNNADGPARLYRIAGGRGSIGFISPVSRHFCNTCNRLRLTADGHLRACLLTDEETDMKGPLRSGCNDAELENLIRQTIAAKPLKYTVIGHEHHLRKCVKEMATIGG
jgi:cyclic pyranopterin phosphate synthase